MISVLGDFDLEDVAQEALQPQSPSGPRPGCPRIRAREIFQTARQRKSTACDDAPATQPSWRPLLRRRDGMVDPRELETGEILTIASG